MVLFRWYAVVAVAVFVLFVPSSGYTRSPQPSGIAQGKKVSTEAWSRRRARRVQRVVKKRLLRKQRKQARQTRRKLKRTLKKMRGERYSLTALSLIDATTNTPVKGFEILTQPFVIDLNALPTNKLSIQANTFPTRVGSVRFTLSKEQDSGGYAVQSHTLVRRQLENITPYSLTGDRRGRFNSWTPDEGNYRLEVEVYKKSRAKGDLQDARSFYFQVRRSPRVPTTPPTAVYTATPTFTAIPTSTSTPVPTLTAAPTSTATPTFTASPTATATSTPTLAPTFTSTPDPIPTPTATSTATPAPTYTPSPTATAIPTATSTATSTPTATATATPSATPSPTYTTIPTATPTPQPTATPEAPPIPMLEQWEANMLNYGAYHCNEEEIQNLTTWEGSVWYYDGIRVYYQIADYTGDASWETCAGYVKDVYRNYVLDENGMVGGWRVFPHGLATDYNRTGETSSRTAALLLATNSPFAWAGGGEDFTLSRETAYLLNAYLTAVELGDDEHENLFQAVNFALSHLDQWAVSKTAHYVQPFMVGLTFEALINHYEMYGDNRVPAAIEHAANWLWEKAWNEEAKAFEYMVCEPGVTYGDCTTGPSPDLNQLIAPAYAWLYKQTGNALYQERADKIFVGGIEGAWMGLGKMFSQNYRWSFDYIKWRSLQ